eukprot:g23041.t1
MVNLHFPSYSRGPKVLERILGVNHDLLAHPVRAIRSGGSAGVDMMHVARGRLDAYFEVGIYPWDVCAGQIIVEEAGGVCLDTMGGKFDLSSRRVMVASSSELASQLAVHLRRRCYDTLDAENYQCRGAADMPRQTSCLRLIVLGASALILLRPDAPVGEDLGKFWVNQPGQLSFEIQFNRGDRVRDLRTVIEKVTGIPPEAQELRANGEMVDKEGQFLEAMDLSDIWVMDDRDDSPERGEWNPDPEEDMSLATVIRCFDFQKLRGRSPKGGSCPSPKLSARRNKGEEDDDDGCEFTFGTSAPIQLPDFSQQKPASATEAKQYASTTAVSATELPSTFSAKECVSDPTSMGEITAHGIPKVAWKLASAYAAGSWRVCWKIALFFAPWIGTTYADGTADEWKLMLKKMEEQDGRVQAGQDSHHPLMILGNHASFLDVILAVVSLPLPVMRRCRTYMDAHLFNLPVLATICRAVGHFPVYFTSSKNGVFAVDKERNEQVDKQVDQFLKEGGWLCFYPEGQRNKSPDELLPFRYGGMKKVIEFDGRLMSLMCYNVQTVWPLKAQMGGYPGRVRMSCKALAPDGVKALLKQLRESDLPPEEKEAEDHVLLAKHLQRTMQQQYDELKAAAMESAKPKKA